MSCEDTLWLEELFGFSIESNGLKLTRRLQHLPDPPAQSCVVAEFAKLQFWEPNETCEAVPANCTVLLGIWSHVRPKSKAKTNPIFWSQTSFSDIRRRHERQGASD